MSDIKETEQDLLVTEMRKWIVDEKLNDMELGKKLRTYYWNVKEVMENW